MKRWLRFTFCVVALAAILLGADSMALRLRPALSGATVQAVTARATGRGVQGQRVRAVIDARKTYAPISKYVYGQFLEHIGSIVNKGLWAEMLDDRKFFYPVVDKEPEAAPGRFGRAPLRRWTAVGPADAVIMDSDRPFTGKHSPLVRLAGAEPRGIRQAGLTLVKNAAYAGRVVLAGGPGAQVAVSLVWGLGANDRQTTTIGRLGAAYKTYPLSFSAASDSADARLEIVGTGSGPFHIGAVSLMPTDNVEGFRREVVAVLKQLRSGVYRFPGGNFVSAHEWRDAIGDRDRRPPRMDPAWNAVQPNDVGTDEFLTLCRLLDVEPYITVNAGFGDAWSAAQLVEYTNGAATTPMGRRRAANGHRQPYGVKFWGIGNEAWGEWQFGAVPLAQFVIKHNLFAEAMRRVDPTITLIASGAMPDAMTGSKQALRLGGKLIPDPLGPADWTGGLLVHCLDNIDLVSEHFYSYANRRFDLAKGDSVPLDPDEPLVDWMRRPANHIRAKVEAYQDYLERIPALRTKPVPICLAEWAYVGTPPNSYKVVPAYAWTFHEMFRHSDLYQMAAFTFATSLVSSRSHEAVLNPAGLLFKLYRDRFGTIPVQVSGNSPQPPPKYPPGGEEPRVNAGSDTFPLDVVAAWSADRRSLTVAVINPTAAEQQLDLSIEGTALAGSGRRWRLSPSDINATIVVGQKPGVEVEKQTLDAVPGTMTLPSWSVSVYEFPAK
jgi:alpha-N-arabinofuranosidase